MKYRCNADHPITHPHYKAKGITVCDRWKSFENFLADMGPSPSKYHEIDRENNDKGYYPENCRWATNTENMRNRSNSIMWVIDGIEYESISEAATALSVSIQTISNWCNGRKSKKGHQLEPKPNCRSYKKYENSPQS